MKQIAKLLDQRTDIKHKYCVFSTKDIRNLFFDTSGPCEVVSHTNTSNGKHKKRNKRKKLKLQHKSNEQQKEIREEKEEEDGKDEEGRGGKC
jgi:hypothetical protein